MRGETFPVFLDHQDRGDCYLSIQFNPWQDRILVAKIVKAFKKWQVLGNLIKNGLTLNAEKIHSGSF